MLLGTLKMSGNKDRIAQKTFAICTVTMSFSAIEDRIVMDSLDQSKKVERLWLSRRLLDRLIPTLTDQLEVNSSKTIPTELEQSLAQEKAEMDKKQSKAVEIRSKNPSWLVTHIQIGRSKNKFRLLFLGKNTNEPMATNNQANFDLAIPNLRQWLNAIHKIYLKAEWETKAFPPWLTENNPKSGKNILLN